MIVDLHSHLLPGVDDGAKTYKDTLALGKLADEEGIDLLVMTPHHNNQRYLNKASDVVELTKKVQDFFINEGVKVKVSGSQEIRITETIIDDYLNEELLSLDSRGKYYLIELPTMYFPEYTQRVFQQLINRGITPVIAHPERHVPFIKDINLLVPLIEMGAVGQLTTTSILGGFGKEIQEVSRLMVEYNLVHFMASDAHSVSWRPYNWQLAHNQFVEFFDAYLLEQFSSNAVHIIEGQDLIKQKPIYKKNKSFFHRLKRNRR